jgi:hypothetical protein
MRRLLGLLAALRGRGAEVVPDPCDCDARCPDCGRVCFGGHASYPGRHTCVDMHQWGGGRSYVEQRRSR